MEKINRMAAHLSIQPVWGMERKRSTGLLDSAENLVENLDNLADVLDKLTDKYDIESRAIGGVEQLDSPTTPIKPTPGATGTTSSREENLFRKMKTCLDSARSLIASLRREKSRLIKREMSVECRMGEIEDYKQHMKQDLTSLNQMVDLLSLRVCQLETEQTEDQANYERLEAERNALKERLANAKQLCQQLNEDNEKLTKENKTLLKERTNTSLKLENKELRYEVEVLVVENAKLKELIRKQNGEEVTSEISDGDLGRSSSLPELDDQSNNNESKFISVSESSDEQ